MVLAHQVADGSGIAAHIALFESDSPLREEGRGGVAWRSTRLNEDDDVVRSHLLKLSRCETSLNVFNFTGNLRGLLQHGRN